MTSASQNLRTAATGKSETPTNQLQAYFSQHKNQIEAALPTHLKADRMCRLAMTAFHQNKALLSCDPKTVFASVIIASQLGLEIGVAGQGYLVPYKGKCTFVPGWQGLVDLVGRGGRAVVWTGAVFDGDSFDYSLGDSPFIKHQPGGEDDPDKLLYTYAVGRVKGSEWPVIEVWPVRKLRSHFKKYNKVGAQHYAFENWEMYCRKIPLLQVLKYVPKSIELNNAMTIDDAHESGKSAAFEGDFVTVTDDDMPPAGNGAAAAGSAGQEQQGAPAKGAQREPSPGPGTKLAKIKKAIEAGRNSTDAEIGDIKFDEARSMIAELPEAERPAMLESLTAAQAEAKARRND